MQAQRGNRYLKLPDRTIKEARRHHPYLSDTLKNKEVALRNREIATDPRRVKLFTKTEDLKQNPFDYTLLTADIICRYFTTFESKRDVEEHEFRRNQQKDRLDQAKVLNQTGPVGLAIGVTMGVVGVNLLLSQVGLPSIPNPMAIGALAPHVYPYVRNLPKMLRFRKDHPTATKDDDVKFTELKNTCVNIYKSLYPVKRINSTEPFDYRDACIQHYKENGIYNIMVNYQDMTDRIHQTFQLYQRHTDELQHHLSRAVKMWLDVFKYFPAAINEVGLILALLYQQEPLNQNYHAILKDFLYYPFLDDIWITYGPDDLYVKSILASCVLSGSFTNSDEDFEKYVEQVLVDFVSSDPDKERVLTSVLNDVAKERPNRNQPRSVNQSHTAIDVS